MNENIYDNTTWNNDINFCNDSYSYDHDENNEPYFNNFYGKRAFPINYMELPCRINKLEEMFYSMHKKAKKHTKKHIKKAKRYKKRLKELEKQNADMMKCFAAMIQQPQYQDKYGWIKRTIENSTPHIIDFASNVVVNHS